MNTLTPPEITSTQRQLLRDLNNEYRDTQVALNQTQASLSRAMKLAEQNYQRKRQQNHRRPLLRVIT